MHKLALSDVADRAIAQPDLLANVVTFKEKFYRTPWAKLTEAKSGTLRLIPPESRLAKLRADYTSMLPMIFGDVPSFDEVIATLVQLERRINGTSD